MVGASRTSIPQRPNLNAISRLSCRLRRRQGCPCAPLRTGHCALRAEARGARAQARWTSCRAPVARPLAARLTAPRTQAMRPIPLAQQKRQRAGASYRRRGRLHWRSVATILSPARVNRPATGGDGQCTGIWWRRLCCCVCWWGFGRGGGGQLWRDRLFPFDQGVWLVLRFPISWRGGKRGLVEVPDRPTTASSHSGSATAAARWRSGPTVTARDGGPIAALPSDRRSACAGARARAARSRGGSAPRGRVICSAKQQLCAIFI